MFVSYGSYGPNRSGASSNIRASITDLRRMNEQTNKKHVEWETSSMDRNKNFFFKYCCGIHFTGTPSVVRVLFAVP